MKNHLHDKTEPVDSTELMIGNILRYKDNSWSGIVEGIGSDYIIVNGIKYNLNDFRPIVITDEILEILGFICKEDKRKSIKDVEYIHKKWILDDWIILEKEDQDIDAECINFDENYFEIDSFDVFLRNSYVTCFSYVHEFQNFYNSIMLAYKIDINKLLEK